MIIISALTLHSCYYSCITLHTLSVDFQIGLARAIIQSWRWQKQKKSPTTTCSNLSGSGPWSVVYEGDVVYFDVDTFETQCKPHGGGKMKFPDGSSYQGEFAIGKPHGEGKMTFSDGSTSEGVWKEGYMHDKGANVTYYIGTCGVISSVFEGDVDDVFPKLYGRGKTIYSFGLDTYIYEPSPLRGSKITYPSGDVYEGEVNKVRRGIRGLARADETGRDKVMQSFLWTFDLWKPHGEGEMTYSNGSTYKGRWDYGSRSGKGSYTGEWRKDREWKTKGPWAVEMEQSALNNQVVINVIAEKDKAISEKDEVIAMKDKDLASMKSALRKHMEREIAERDEEIELLKAKLNSMAQMTSGEESPDQEEEDDDDDEENPEAKRQRTGSGLSRNATNNRASRSRSRAMMVQVKHENMKEGIIKCPDPQCNKIILHNGGCKILTCTNHRPRYLYFCAHCKKVGEEGSEIIRCECPNRNTQADRDFAQEMRNQRSRENLIRLDGA